MRSGANSPRRVNPVRPGTSSRTARSEGGPQAHRATLFTSRCSVVRCSVLAFGTCSVLGAAVVEPGCFITWASRPWGRRRSARYERGGDLRRRRYATAPGRFRAVAVRADAANTPRTMANRGRTDPVPSAYRDRPEIALDLRLPYRDRGCFARSSDPTIVCGNSFPS